MTRIYVLIACLAACVERDGLMEAEARQRETIEFAADGRAPVDVLIVMDTSCNMPVFQPRVAAQMGRLTEALDAFAPGSDVRIGLVTTSLGGGAVVPCADDRGELRPGTCLAGSDEYLIDGIDWLTRERVTNYGGSLDEAVRCLVEAGVNGCGVEQPLEAMKLALERPGFLRPEADLVVLLVTNEDDTSVATPAYFTVASHADENGLDFQRFRFGVVCDPDDPEAVGVKSGCRSREDSPYLHPVSRYVDFLRGLKPDPSRIAVAGIVGVPTRIEVVGATSPYGEATVVLDDACEDVNGVSEWGGLPAVRVASFVTSFGARGALGSVCDRDYPVLTTVGELAMASATRHACFAEHVADTSAATGLQPLCEVELLITGLDPVPLVPCRSGDEPLCWRVAFDGASCVELVGPAQLPLHTRVRATCDTVGE